jgi:GAF domain-containing protein
VLAVARRELQMDVALLSEVRDGREIVLWAVSNGRLPEFVAGASAPLRDTVCQRLLDGRIDGIVHDARADTRVNDLPAVRETGLGAYIGVPLTGAAARRYVLCCVAREARPDLSDSDVRFLRGLVESVRPAVDRAAGAA